MRWDYEWLAARKIKIYCTIKIVYHSYDNYQLDALHVYNKILRFYIVSLDVIV